MKIKLEHPFTEKYKTGYLMTNKEPRRLVILIEHCSKKRKTISYARYLYGVKLGHEVPSEFQVDHIDNDKMNDNIKNLQLLTSNENSLKGRPKQKLIKRICPICNTEFDFKLANLSSHPNPTCSRKCGGIKSVMTHKSSENYENRRKRN
jgi:hypothetical protein